MTIRFAGLSGAAILVIGLLLAWTGCADDPSIVGAGLLPGSDYALVEVDTLYADTTSYSSTYTVISTATQDFNVATWLPSTLFLGQRQPLGVQQSLDAATFIRFLGLPDSLQGITVTSAELVLYLNSFYGDSTDIAAAPITIYGGRGLWTGDSLTYDSLDAGPGLYYDPTPRPPGAGVVRTDTGTVSIPLDTALVAEWFTNTSDTSSGNGGVFLTANAMNTVWGFWSFAHLFTQYYPILRIEYTKDGVAGSYDHRSGFARYLAKIPQNDLVADPARLYVHTGIAYRAHLTFDISILPAPISLHRARLLLTLDSTSSEVGTYGSDSLFTFGEKSSGAIETSTIGLGGPTYVAGRRTYDFSADAAVRYWQNSTVPNTLVMAGRTEISSLSRFVFYGPGAAADLRPKLIVTYSRVLGSGEGGVSQ